MEIRLAQQLGLLSQPNPNMFQHFAAQYWVQMDRRVAIDDIEDTLQRMTWYLDPDRYEDLFLMGEIAASRTVTLEGGETEEVQDDIDEIDRYFDQLEEKKSLTGAQLFSFLDDNEDGWV